MKKQLYLDIVTRLKTILNDDETPAPVFKHFDLWNRQVEFMEQETPFEFPAVFIEFMPHNWETMGKRRLQSDIRIRLHIVTRWFAQTADYSPDSAEALEYLDLVNKVTACLQGADMTDSNAFVRVSSIPNHNHVGLLDSVEEYMTRITDDSAVKKLEEVTVAPVVYADNQEPPPPPPPLQATYRIEWIDGELISEGSILVPDPGHKLIQINRPTYPDATYDLKDSGGDLILSDSIAAGEHEDIVAPDATYSLEVNGNFVESGAIKSNAVKIIKYAHAPSGLHTALPLLTGQSISTFRDDDGATRRGRLNSYYILDYPNYFGHNHRFTGINGGYYDFTAHNYYDILNQGCERVMAFPGEIMIDWASWNPITGVMLMWFMNTEEVPSHIYQNVNAFVRDMIVQGFADWYIPNRKEAESLICSERDNYWLLNCRNILIIPSYSATGFYTSTFYDHSSVIFLHYDGLVGKVEPYVSALNTIPVRYGNISELGD